MKIAVLNWRDLAHPDSGGAEVFVHEVAGRWVSAGHDVTIYSSDLRNGAPTDIDGVKIARHGSLKRGTHHFLSPKRVLEDRPDVMLESINTVPYFLPMRRHFVPFLPLVHQLAVDVWDSHFPRPVAAVARRVEPRLYLPYRNTACVAVSDSTKQDLASAGVEDVTVVPQGGLGPQTPGAKEDVPTFVFVGRLAVNKRPDHAIRAFGFIRQRVPNARLWVIGDGEMKEQLARSLPEGATLLGRLPRNEQLDRLGRAHALLMTSVREGWGLVVTEANALGTPAVGYDVPGLRDSIRSGITGVLTPVDPERMGRAAVELVDDVGTYERMRAKATHWGGGCSWDKTALSLLERLSAIASRPSVAAI